jgi:hypothetical protein
MDEINVDADLAELEMSEPVDDEELENRIEEDLPSILPARTRPKDFVAQVDPEEVQQGLQKLGEEDLLTFVGKGGYTYKEPQRAHNAFIDYLQMGSDRSLSRLAERYFNESHAEWKDNTFFSIERTLKEYSRNYNWQQRVRDKMAKVSAKALAKAQREAALNARYRNTLAQLMQKSGALIILKAKLHSLDEDEARKLLKPAATMMKIGFESERAEAGESLTKITPPTPIDQMTDEELESYISTLVSELT